MKRILLAILLSCEISMANTIEEKVFSNPNDKIINGGLLLGV